METISPYADRIAVAKEHIAAAYRQAPCSPPLLVQDVNYWMDGEVPALIPADYFTNPAAITDFQLRKIRRHLATVDDDYVPFLMPWFGTTVVPSALGCEVVYNPNGDPSLRGPILRRPADIAKLRLPDPYRDGQMPAVLAAIDYMRETTDLPVGVTDAQGPLNIALSLAGVEKLFVWMYDDPQAVHALMEFCTEALIEWLRVQKRHAGQPLDGGAFPHAIWLPDGLGGVWISDDDCSLVSARLYREFVVPYNSRVLKAFGGGTLHYCGSADHQLANFAAMDGLIGINNFCLGDFTRLARLQRALGDRMLVMACDFAPTDPNQYFRDLFRNVDPKGLIVASFISPMFALDNGKYLVLQRDAEELTLQVHEAMRSAMLAAMRDTAGSLRAA